VHSSNLVIKCVCVQRRDPVDKVQYGVLGTEYSTTVISQKEEWKATTPYYVSKSGFSRKEKAKTMFLLRSTPYSVQ
jgi:hypothetical protein